MNQEVQELDKCTFKPDLSKTLKSTEEQERDVNSFFERTQLWHVERELRLEKEREREREFHEQECTF